MKTTTLTGKPFPEKFGILFTDRELHLLLDALNDTINSRKFYIVHVKKNDALKPKNNWDLTYPQYISKLCNHDEIFSQKIEIYNKLIEGFDLPDIAGIHNKEKVFTK